MVAPSGGQDPVTKRPLKLTTDSTDMFLGGDINHHLIIGDSCSNYAIETGGFVVPGACATHTANAGYVMAQFRTQSFYGEKIALNIASLNKGKPTNSWGDNVPAIIATIKGDDKDALKATVGLGGIKWKQDNDSGSISLCGGSFAKNCGLTVSSDGQVKIGMAGILALDTAGKNYVQWYPTKNGDWNMGTSIAGGGNIRGVIGYYGVNATIKGTINTNNLDTNTLNVAQGMQVKGNMTANTLSVAQGMQVNSNLNIGSGKSIVFLTPKGVMGAYAYSNEAGDLVIQSNRAGGGSIVGVNGYYGNSATIKGDINTKNLIANSITVAQGMQVNSNLNIGSGKSIVYLTSKGVMGAFTFSDDTGNLAIQSNQKTGGGVATATYRLADLPKAPATDHVMLWCSDCKINGIAGAPVWWHASIAKWTDSQNNNLVN